MPNLGFARVSWPKDDSCGKLARSYHHRAVVVCELSHDVAVPAV